MHVLLVLNLLWTESRGHFVGTGDLVTLRASPAMHIVAEKRAPPLQVGHLKGSILLLNWWISCL